MTTNTQDGAGSQPGEVRSSDQLGLEPERAVPQGWKRYVLIESDEGGWCISTPEDADDMAQGVAVVRRTELALPEALVDSLPEHQGW